MHLWCNKKIVFYCDNMSVNSGKSFDPDAVDGLQRLFLLSVINNCEFKAVHLSYGDNFVVDAISRAHVNSFRGKLCIC